MPRIYYTRGNTRRCSGFNLDIKYPYNTPIPIPPLNLSQFPIAMPSCYDLPWLYKQTNRQTNKQTNRQTNKQTDRQTNKQTNKKMYLTKSGLLSFFTGFSSSRSVPSPRLG